MLIPIRIVHIRAAMSHTEVPVILHSTELQGHRPRSLSGLEDLIYTLLVSVGWLTSM